jgi:5-dehydro-2-deoxygluconokinase
MDLTAALQRPLLVIGRAGFDAFTAPGVALEAAETLTLGLGGSAANIAAGYVRLGGAAALLTCVSDDAVGRFCEAQLDRHGVDRRHVRRVGGEARNSLAVYESRVEGHRNVIYRNGAADFEMNAADVDAVDWPAFGAVAAAGTVFAAEPSRGAAFHAVERARDAGLPVLFDVDYRPYSWHSPKVAEEVLSRAGALADLIVGNDEEFGFMAGGIDRGLDHARGLAGEGRTVIYKMGERGAVTFRGGTETRTGVYRTEALKPTGAGDSFMAGLLAACREGRPFREAVLRGSACAAIVVARPGCAPAMPTPEELDAFLADRPDPEET